MYPETIHARCGRIILLHPGLGGCCGIYPTCRVQKALTERWIWV